MPPTSIPQMTTDTARWRSRPIAATLVRIVAFGIPFATGLAASGAFAELVGRPDGVSVWVWRALVVGIATAVALAVDPLARRLLPLAALLQMSLLFPDRAPSRWGLALGVGSASDLTRLLATDTTDHTAAEAASHVLALVAALGRHDRITRGHSERVWGYARLIAAELDLSRAETDRLQWAALLHDVGKLYVAPEILNKRGKLTPAEFAQIKVHPGAGAELIAPLAEWLGPWADAVSHHHERFDGTGYPYGLAGKDISLGGRIVAVIDTYDVITCARSYKRPISSRLARAELLRCAGTHFDPDIVHAFVNISTGRVRYAAGPLAGLAQLPFVSAVAQTGAVVATITPAAAIPAATALAVSAIVTAGPVAAAPGPSQPIARRSTAPASAGAILGGVSPQPAPTGHQLDATPTTTLATTLATGTAAPSRLLIATPSTTTPSTTTPSTHGAPAVGAGTDMTPTVTPVVTIATEVVTAEGSASATAGTGPSVTVTPVTVPPVTVPPVTVPPVTVPPVTLPPVTMPPLTLPPVTLPPVTLPPVTVPPITLPTVTLPPVTLPPITVPPIKLPSL